MTSEYQIRRARETARKNFRIDGRSGHPLYDTWRAMVRRCRQSPSYVERGTEVCELWIDSPWAFYNHVENEMPPRPSKHHTLDRENNDEDYRPGNLRWADPKTQANNRGPRRNRRLPGWWGDCCLCPLMQRLVCPCSNGITLGEVPASGLDPVHRSYNPPPVKLSPTDEHLALLDLAWICADLDL